MFSVINEIIRSLTVPYFIALIASIVLLFLLNGRKAIGLSLIVLFSITWRLAFPIYSSRYCAFFIIITVLSTIVFLKEICSKYKKIKTTVIPLLVGMFLVNTGHLNSSFRKSFIFDTQEGIKHILENNKQSSVFILNKDYNRLHSSDKEHQERQVSFFYMPNTYDDFVALYRGVKFWEDDIYFIFPEDKDQPPIPQQINMYKGGANVRKIQHYNTNRKNTSFFSVYFKEKHVSPLENNHEILNDPLLSNVIKKGTLRSCNLQYDVFIYQYENNLFWFIGSEIDKETSILYVLETNRPDLLPQHRIKSGFDVRGFRIGSKYDLGTFGGFRVFKRSIPEEYPITRIRVGFKINDSYIWFSAIHISNLYPGNSYGIGDTKNTLEDSLIYE